MASPARKRATYEDLLQVPDHLLLGTFAGDAVVCAEPFEAIELDLLFLWGETRGPA